MIDTSYLTQTNVKDPIKQVSTTTTQTTAAPKANFWDTLFKAADSTANVINAIKQPAQPAAPYYGGTYNQPVQPQQDNTMRNVLIVGGIGVAAIAAWAIFGKPKKK